MIEENVTEGVDALTLTNDLKTPAEVEDIVDPWNVSSTSNTGVDYDKLISKNLTQFKK